MGNQVYHEQYCHVVWSTKWRRPLIDAKWHGWMLEKLTAIAAKRHVHVVAIGVLSDHVHMLMKLPPTGETADLVGQIKGASAFAHNSLLPGISEKLVWQAGYGLISVSPYNVETVARYVHNQAAHHAQGTLDEMLENDGSDADDPLPQSSDRLLQGRSYGPCPHKTRP